MDTYTVAPVVQASPASSLKRIFLGALVASLSISALVAIFIFLFGEFGEMEIRILFTTLAIGGFSLTGLCSSVLYDRGTLRPFAVFGMLVAVIGFLIAVLGIWELIADDDLWKPLFISIILSFSIAHISLLSLARSESGRMNLFLTLTVVFIAIVAGMLVMPILNDFEDLGEFYFRLLGVFAVLDVLGTILVPILRKVWA